MEMNNEFRSEVHVAHKSRREKMRVQQDHRLNPSHHGLSSYNAHSLQQIHGDHHQDGLNFSQVGSVRYDDPSQLCSDMNTFPVNSQVTSSLLCKETENKRVVLDPTFGNFSGTMPNHGDPQHFSSTWKSIGPQSSRSISDSNWLANNQSQIFPCDDHGLSGSSALGLRIMNSNSTPMDVSNVQNMQCDALPNQNTAFEILASAPSNVRSFALEVESFNKPQTCDNRAEPRQVNWILGPDYANGSNQWNSDLDHHHDRLVSSRDMNSNPAQALCLTLSSVPLPKVHSKHIADHETPSVVNIPSNISHPVNPGPLGPFTGYATILESSKFLRPTQQLLDEICCIACPKNLETSCDMSDPRIFEESSVSNDAELAGDAYGSSLRGDRFGDKSREVLGGASSPLGSHGPENLRKKAKLIYMQEEVCKRYKHYHQQMQMVVSSFESVSALSAATPYISLALRTVSKHFRNLKNAIANKLKTLKNALGEDHSSSSAAPKAQYPGSSSSSMLKFPEQSFPKPKSVGVIENQHVWRPQRGLPEHAVSVLRAWLFDHFLHPYPTDTDKHMLAAQTGLTRNQVSNWFINARVRVWKPMVEEVHMLETETMSETGHNNPEKPKEHSMPDPSRNSNPNRFLNRPNTISHNADLPPNDETWKSQEKRSRTEYDHYHHHHRNQVVNFDFDGSMMANAVPSTHHSGIEMGGLGSVSLTLGLRQSAENGQRHLEHRMRPCFGGQL